MLSFGLMFLVVNGLYVFFSILVGVITYFIIRKKSWIKQPKRKWVAIGLFLVVLVAPFYDLFIQKGIKTYYETFEMEPKIYAYPERDENGKIESLGIGDISPEISNYFENQKILKKYAKNWQNWVNNYIELYIYDTVQKTIGKDGKVKHIINKNNPISYYVRIYLNKELITYEKFNSEKEYRARYQIKKESNSYFFYTKTIAEFRDIKKDILLAKSIGIGFNRGDNYNDKFRNKYLLFRGPSGLALSIYGVGTYRKVYNELFFNKKLK